MDKDKNPLPEIKFARMEDSLSDDGTLDPEKDNDRFFIRIPNGKSLGNVSVEVGTAENPDDEYNDNPTKVTLIADGDDLISKPLLLVSDAVDDNHDSADDAAEDQTHKGQLGGKFRISSITVDGQQQDMSADFQIYKGRNLDLKIALVGNTGLVAKPNLKTHVETTVRERFAQCGIWIDEITIDDAEWKSEYGAASPFYIRNEDDDGDLEIPPGTTALLKDAAEWADGKIVVLYVPTLFDWNENNAFGSKRGVALTPSLNWPYLDQGHRNIIVINSKLSGPWVLSHELCHIIGDIASHYESSDEGKTNRNLLVDFGREGLDPDNKKITGPKRIYESQPIE